MEYSMRGDALTAAATVGRIVMAAVESVLLVVREVWAEVQYSNDGVDVVRQNHTDFSGFILNAFHKEWSSKHYGYQYEKYGTYSNGDMAEDGGEGLKYGRKKR